MSKTIEFFLRSQNGYSPAHRITRPTERMKEAAVLLDAAAGDLRQAILYGVGSRYKDRQAVVYYIDAEWS